MSQYLRRASATRLFPVPLFLALAACASAPDAGSSDADQQVRIEGQVIAVDTDPWAYDGNAVVTVDTGFERIGVQFPARWNLCQAQLPGDLQALRPGDRVQAIGASTAAGELVVCAHPQHLLRKLD